MSTTRQVSRTVVVPSPAGRVWEAVADPAVLARWLRVDLDVDLRPGAWGRASEDGEDREVVVDAVEPQRRLAFSWWPTDTGPAGGSSVEIRLAPAQDGTRVSVCERALTDVVPPPAPPGREGPAHAAGEPPLASVGAPGGAGR